MIRVIILVTAAVKSIDQTINRHKYNEKVQKRREEWNKLTPTQQADQAIYSIFA